jgi:hypothetical protein
MSPDKRRVALLHFYSLARTAGDYVMTKMLNSTLSRWLSGGLIAAALSIGAIAVAPSPAQARDDLNLRFGIGDGRSGFYMSTGPEYRRYYRPHYYRRYVPPSWYWRERERERERYWRYHHERRWDYVPPYYDPYY